MRAVVVHDGALHPGGAVDVAIEAARALDGDLVVGLSGVADAWWEARAPNDVRVLKRVSKRSTLGDARLAWRLLNLDLEAYDLVLTSGPAAKFYHPADGQRRAHYMHHPPLRVLWSEGGLATYLIRTIDRIETWGIPLLIANSRLTAERIEALYDRTADAVVHPPVDVDRFSPDEVKRGDEVVLVGRLEERKRPEVAIDAFRGFEGPEEERPQLHVLGDGPLRAQLERSAPDNVHFHGYVEGDELVERVERAAAGLFVAKREDFGIVPVEYLAAGTPVVGVDEPNTNDQIEDGETGVLVEPTSTAVRAGVREALERSWDPELLREAAEGYGIVRFHEELREALAEGEA